MVEGGPATARSFLAERLVDRAIIIQAPMEFDQSPVPSGMREATLAEAGLFEIARHRLWGPDSASLWAREGAVWPGKGSPEAWP